MKLWVIFGSIWPGYVNPRKDQDDDLEDYDLSHVVVLLYLVKVLLKEDCFHSVDS